MVERIALLAFTFAMTACASSPPEALSSEGTTAAGTEPVAAADIGSEDEVICRREKREGSNFTRKVCYTRANVEEKAARDQNTMRQMRALKSSSFTVLN